MTTENQPDPSEWLESYLCRATTKKRPVFARGRREIYRLLVKRLTADGRECPYKGLEVCLQRCFCEEGPPGGSKESRD